MRLSLEEGDVSAGTDAYYPGVRPLGRRRPAGKPQVPALSAPPSDIAVPIEPTIVRLGMDRTVLDSPWDTCTWSISHVWPHERVRGVWSRGAWPVHPTNGRSVAPVDLHIGHVLEVGRWIDDRWSAVYGWVAEARQDRFVLVPAASAMEAVEKARRSVDLWRAAQLEELEDAWRRCFASYNRFRGGAS